MIQIFKWLTKLKPSPGSGMLSNTSEPNDRGEDTVLFEHDNLVIRKYRSSDKKKILRITESSFEGVSLDQNIQEKYGIIGKAWREHKKDAVLYDLRKNPHLTVVATCNGAVVGFICCRYYPTRSIGHIANLAVKREFQGQKIGKKLLDLSLKLLKDQGAKHVKIETLEQNDRAVNFYSNDGFQEVGRQIFYFKEI